ncbi:MAG: TIM barrel protein [Verrucomicrobiota bacterium]|nr:TIM barrel protein [Verrucomicrobiota bacterium]
MEAQKNSISRRKLMATAAATAATITGAQSEENKKPFRIKNNRIRQSIMGWCFNPMPTMELAKHCKEIGLVAMEGIDSKHYPAVRELGLKISLVSGGHGFKNGPCNPKNTETVINGLKKGIDLAADIGTKSVITFTGMSYKDMNPDKAADLCVETWKKVMPHAEKKGITLVLEHLNSRDDSHPMKGHPGYFGDDVDFCAKLVNGVGSKNFKLLFDVYHVQVMNGDVIRRIKQYKDIIGHYHTAGCPGRGELDDTQEINYPPVLRTILETGYEGYVAQEFIPTWKDPIQSLRHAAEICDI